MNNSEFFWDDLLLYLEERRVVPVIGQDVLTVTVEGQTRDAYSLLGQKLMDGLKIQHDVNAGDCRLNQVVSDNLGLMDDRNQIYSNTKRAFDALKLPVPEALRLLARITAFRLFITTSFDPWMKQALDEERFGGRPKTEVVAYNPRDAADLRLDQLRSGNPVVYQLFGRICGTPGTYAVTEEDLLEFFHHLQAQPPRVLCDELKDSHLLFIGNAFPDWLARFFIRTARENRLSAFRERVEFVVEDERHADNPFTQFFRRFSRQTKFYSAPPAQFVRDLAARWAQSHPDDQGVGGAPAPAPVTGIPPEQCIFISYAREDGEAARRLRQAMEQAGLNTWMDETNLAGGEDWKLTLKSIINRCAVFVPVISKNTEARHEGQFREEWDWAVQRIGRFAGSGRDFIMPVTVDPVNFYAARVPEAFQKAHAVAASGGEPPPNWLQKLSEMMRSLARQERSAA